MPAIRLLPFGRADGAWNMAADEVLLAGAAYGLASLRFYGWDEATVSLGYFQESAPVLAHPRLASLHLVRRASGGAALVHHHEITYAIAIPAESPWLDRRSNWLQRMHEILVTVLDSFGVKGTRCTHDEVRGPILCFLHHTPEDILIGHCKVVGSAQRKQRDALLQHGGILLSQSPHTPELPGILECAGVALDPVSLQEAITQELAQRLGCEVAPSDWSGAERAQIQELAESRYRSVEWNRRR